MYNSSIKGQGSRIKYEKHIEIPDKIFYNDMSKTFVLPDAFKKADVVYSEISWLYGWKVFSERAEASTGKYADYLKNINSCIESLHVPAFIVCGKHAQKYFPNATVYDISIVASHMKSENCKLYVWNYVYPIHYETTEELLASLSKQFNTVLDFSCGYGEHLMAFNDFIACDINKDCLTYLSLLYQKRKDTKVWQDQKSK